MPIQIVTAVKTHSNYYISYTIEIILVDPGVLPAVSLLVSLPDRSVSNFLSEGAGVPVPLSVDDPAYVRGRAEVVRHSCDPSRRDVQELGWVRDGGVRGEPRELQSITSTPL